MDNQTVYNKPTNQPDQNNNMLAWMIPAIVLLLLFLYFIFNRDGNNTTIAPTPNPQLTQVPQNSQDTQIPQPSQIPQQTQIPQPSQIPQDTTAPTPTVKL